MSVRFATYDNLLSIQMPALQRGRRASHRFAGDKPVCVSLIECMLIGRSGLLQPAAVPLYVRKTPHANPSGLGANATRSWKPFGGTKILTESLILAQDERWRRA